MFDNDYLKKLPADSFEAGKIICDAFFEKHRALTRDEIRRKHFDFYINALAVGHVFVEAHNVKLPILEIDYERGNTDSNRNIVVKFFSAWRELVKTELTRRETLEMFEQAKGHYGSMLGKVVLYEFSNKDFKRVQTLINELRDLISQSGHFEEDHRQRLLKRLEKLQGELHKKMSNLDMLWGLIGDAGVALGKFGKDAKPLVDRIREIAGIAWDTQARAENVAGRLPLRLLEGKESNEGEKEA